MEKRKFVASEEFIRTSNLQSLCCPKIGVYFAKKRAKRFLFMDTLGLFQMQYQMKL